MTSLPSHRLRSPLRTFSSKFSMPLLAATIARERSLYPTERLATTSRIQKMTLGWALSSVKKLRAEKLIAALHRQMKSQAPFLDINLWARTFRISKALVATPLSRVKITLQNFSTCTASLQSCLLKIASLLTIMRPSRFLSSIASGFSTTIQPGLILTR